MEWMMFFFGLSLAAAILASIKAVHKDVKEIKERLKD